MSIKILVQTLTEIPDIQLLEELTVLIKKQEKLIISDLRKFYEMFNSLYSSLHKNKVQFMKILPKTMQLNNYVIPILLIPDIEVFWRTVASSIIHLLGEQDELIRQQARSIIRNFLIASNNYFIVFQSIFDIGIQIDKQPSLSVIIYSIKYLGRLLQQFSSLVLLTNSLQNVDLLKKLFEQLLRITNKNHLQASKTAKQFLIRVFYMKIERIQEVLQRLTQPYADQLQKIWQKEQNNVLKQKQQNQQFQSVPNQYIQVKFQHLPMINQKTFGIFQPFVFKEIFNPDSPSSLKFAIKELKDAFTTNQQKLIPYVNALYKVTMMMIARSGKNITAKVISPYSVQLLQILERIFQIPGICKLVHLQHCSKTLCQQLDNENVLYRRCLRSNLKKLNFLNPKKSLKICEQELEKQDNKWLQVYQLLLVIQHWIQNIPDGNLPTLSKILSIIIGNQINKKSNAKIQQKCQQLLIMILEKYPQYRQDLQVLLDQSQIGMIQDILQSRKNGTKIPRDNNEGRQAEQIFMKQYQQQRKKYLKTVNKK